MPDEARTFGMDSLFPTLKIYSPHGQQYTSVDRELMLSYKESETGQILHEGINEAGSVASFTAVGTSYSTHDVPMIPIYIFYSMFGFQRIGDLAWAAGDLRAAGFDQLRGRCHRATGSQQVVDDQHLLPRLDRVVVDFDHGLPVFQLVLLLDGLRGQLALLADRHETNRQLMRNGPADDDTKPKDDRNMEPPRHTKPRLRWLDQSAQDPDPDQGTEHVRHGQAKLA